MLLAVSRPGDDRRCQAGCSMQYQASCPSAHCHKHNNVPVGKHPMAVAVNLYGLHAVSVQQQQYYCLEAQYAPLGLAAPRRAGSPSGSGPPPSRYLSTCQKKVSLMFSTDTFFCSG